MAARDEAVEVATSEFGVEDGSGGAVARCGDPVLGVPARLAGDVLVAVGGVGQ